MKNRFKLLFDFLEKEKQQREIKRKAYLEQLRQGLKALLKSVNFKEVYVFGSITKPYSFFEGISDIDICFVGLDNKDLLKAYRILSDISDYIQVIRLEDVKYERFKQKILSGIIWKKQDLIS